MYCIVGWFTFASNISIRILIDIVTAGIIEPELFQMENLKAVQAEERWTELGREEKSNKSVLDLGLKIIKKEMRKQCRVKIMLEFYIC